MKKLAVSLTIACMFASGLQFASFAKGPMDQDRPFNSTQMQKRGEGIAAQLNLTEEQAAQAKEMREKSRAKIKPVIEEFRAEKRKYRDMRQNNASQEELAKQKEKVMGLMKQAKEIHKQNLENFESILTSDQKAQFEKIKQQRMERFKERKSRKFNKMNNKRFENFSIQDNN